MPLLHLFTGMILGFWMTNMKDPQIRFLVKQIQILKRILADHGVKRVICNPDERTTLLDIGSEIKHDVRSIFLVNTWPTYRKWLIEKGQGKQSGRPGRKPKFTLEQITLIKRIAEENICAGLTRIVGELKKLNISVSRGTVRSILRQYNISPPDNRKYTNPGNWKKLMANTESLLACDFFTKNIHTFKGKVQAYVLVFIHLKSRKVWTTAATLNPNQTWCRQQAVNASFWIDEENLNFKHLIRDRDKKFTDKFDSIFKDLANDNKAVIKTGIRMPKMNAFAESWIGHFKSECLNHFLCFSLSQLDHIVYEYTNFYNNYRPHQGKDIGNNPLNNNALSPPGNGKVRRKKILAGLLNHYYRDAA